MKKLIIFNKYTFYIAFKENCLYIIELRNIRSLIEYLLSRFFNNDLDIVNKNLAPIIDIVINFMKVLTQVRTIIQTILFI